MPTQWYLPESAQDARDTVEDVAAILSFLRNMFALVPLNEIPLQNQTEQFGHCLLLSFMADTLDRAVDALGKKEVV